MKIDENQLKLLEKIYELSLRGCNGEKESAKDKLQKILDRNRITLEDFLSAKEESIDNEIFLQYPEELNFFTQIVASELGHVEGWRMKYKTRREKGKDRFVFKLPKSTFIFLVAKHDFYYSLYLKEAKLFRTAFIQKNSLFAKRSSTAIDDEVSNESREELLKITKMMTAIERTSFVKALID